MFSYFDNDPFGYRCVAALGHAINGYEYIGFRIICSRVAFWNIIRHDNEQFCDPFPAITIIIEVNFFTCFKTVLIHILLIHKNHAPLVVNAAVTVLKSVNSCIKLVMAAY